MHSLVFHEAMPRSSIDQYAAEYCSVIFFFHFYSCIDPSQVNICVFEDFLSKMQKKYEEAHICISLLEISYSHNRD